MLVTVVLLSLSESTPTLTPLVPTSSIFFASRPSVTSVTVYSPGTRPVSSPVLLWPFVMVMLTLPV